MSLRLKSWFFTITATATKKGTRFRNNDRPNQDTFTDQLESSVFKTEIEDRAKVDTGAFSATNNGHVVLATNTQAKNNEAQKEDRSLVVQPHQLPTVETIDQTTEDTVFGFPPRALISVNTSSETNNNYQVKLSEEWYANLLSVLPIPVDTSGKAALYINEAEGDDENGDGSVFKPFATLAKGKSVVLQDQTLIVFGGVYNNNVNMAKVGVRYTIYCYPGVIVKQSDTSFLNNNYNNADSITVVNIFGKPDIIAQDDLGGEYLFEITPKGSGYQYFELKEVKSETDIVAKAVKITGDTTVQTVANRNIIYFNAALVSSGFDHTIVTEGDLPMISLKVGTITTTLEYNATLLEVGTATYTKSCYYMTLANSVFWHGGGLERQKITGIKFVKPSSSSFTVKDASWRLGVTDVQSVCIDLNGLGDVSNRVLLQNSNLFITSTGGTSIKGVSGDKISVNNSVTNRPLDTATITNVGTDGLIIISSTTNFDILEPFDF